MAKGLDWESIRRLLEVWNDYLDADDDMSLACRERFEAAVAEIFGAGVAVEGWDLSLARRYPGALPDICRLDNGYCFQPSGEIRFTLDSGEDIGIRRR